MTPTPDVLAERLVESVRGHGLEAGIRASLEAVYLRWLSLQDPMLESSLLRDGDLSALLIRSATDEVELRTLEQLDPRILWQLISGLQNLPHPAGAAAEYLRAVFEALLSLRTSRLGRAAGESASRDEIARAISGLCGEGARLIDPACGIGTSLMIAASGPRERIVGYEINRETSTIARMRCQIAGVDAEIRNADWLLSSSDDLGSWDAVCLEPPFSLRLSEDQRANNQQLADVASYQGDLVWLHRAAASLSPMGYAAVLLPLSSLTSSKTQKARQNLLAQGAVEALIQLPAGAAFGTSVETCLWVLRGIGHRPTPRVILGRVSRLRHERSAEHSELDEIVSAVARWRTTSELGDIDPWNLAAVPLEFLVGEGTPLPSAHLTDVPVETEERPQAPVRHLSELRLANFKGIGAPQRIPLRPLTLIYGQNSSGKSSLIQALMLFRQSLPTTSLAISGPLVDLGSYRGLVHRHEAARHVSIGVSFGTSPVLDHEEHAPTPAMLRSVDAVFAEDPRGDASSRSVTIGLANEISLFTREEGADSYEITPADVARLVDTTSRPEFWYPHGKVSAYRPDPGRRVARLLQRNEIETVRLSATSLLPPGQIETDLRSSGTTRPDLEGAYVRRSFDALRVVTSELATLFSRMAYLGPLREAPRRFSSRGAPRNSAIDMAYFLLDNASERQEVSAWMARLGLKYELEVVSLAAVSEAHVFGDLVAIALRDSRSNATLSPADVGFGISQVLPILVELSARTESVVLIEQPEIHLHPAMQAELADILVESIDNSGRRNQVIAETHSEHIMLRVQRRVREGSLSADDVAVLYVDQNDEGTASVQQLRLKDDGEFADSWPHGFFAERFDEIFSDLL